MKKRIIYILTLAIAATGGLFAQAQKSDTPEQLREVTVYVLRTITGSEDVAESQIIPVKRRVDVRSPLAATFRAMTAGVSEAESENGFSNLISGLEFDSAQITNKTAQINFTSELGFEWGEPMRSLFPEAIEKTALQFAGVKRVLICVDGISDYLQPDALAHKKCPGFDAPPKRLKTPPPFVGGRAACSVNAFTPGDAAQIVKVYAKPDEQSAILKIAESSGKMYFRISGSDGKGWFEVSRIEQFERGESIVYEGRGWIRSAQTDTVVANALDTRLFAAPSQKSRPLKRLTPNESEARPRACRGEWMQVKSGDTIGWLMPDAQCALSNTACP